MKEDRINNSLKDNRNHSVVIEGADSHEEYLRFLTRDMNRTAKLTRSEVKELLPYFVRFVETGTMFLREPEAIK